MVGGVPSCLQWMRTLTLFLQPAVLCWGVSFPEEPSSLPAVRSGISHGLTAFLTCNESFTGVLLQIHVGGSTKVFFLSCRTASSSSF